MGEHIIKVEALAATDKEVTVKKLKIVKGKKQQVVHEKFIQKAEDKRLQYIRRLIKWQHSKEAPPRLPSSGRR